MDNFYREVGCLDTRLEELNEMEQARIEKRVAAAPQKRKPRLAVFLVAAILALTACAVTVVNYQDWFSFVTSPSSEEITQELFSDMGVVVGQTVDDEENGVSITLDGYLYDGERIALAMTVSNLNLTGDIPAFGSVIAEEGKMISPSAQERSKVTLQELGYEWTQEEFDQYWDSVAGWYSLREFYITQIDAEQHTARLEAIFDVPSYIKPGDAVKLQIKNLMRNEENVIPGEFVFAFSLPERKLIRYYQGETFVESMQGTIKVTGVKLTPSSIHIECSGPYEEENAEEFVIECVRLQDGTIVTINGHGLRTESEDSGQNRLVELNASYHDWQFVSPDDIIAICIGEDIWIELSKLEEYTPQTEE